VCEACKKTAEPIEVSLGIWDSGGPKELRVWWGPGPSGEKQFFSGASPAIIIIIIIIIIAMTMFMVLSS